MMPFFQANRLIGLNTRNYYWHIYNIIELILLIIIKINPIIILYMKRILKSSLIYNYIIKMYIKYTSRGPIRAIKTILKAKKKYNILYVNVR